MKKNQHIHSQHTHGQHIHSQPTVKKWQFWVDRGGTFTDIVALSPDGHVRTHKLLSENPCIYPDAVLYGIRHIMGIDTHAPMPPHSIDTIKMGTTVATNALLERKGDRTALVITEGFGDLLRIGYQNRPHLFDLHIKLPKMLYEQVIEVSERLDKNGTVITPLNIRATTTALQAVFDTGVRSLAIALMHGYKHTLHEQQIQILAENIGFTHISLSHKTAPLIKLVSRGFTTVVDAYLSPMLRRYVGQVENAIGDTNLLFMQSHGGLTSAKSFQGKDAILSGPAGGVVGMVQTAKQAGFHKLIGFDMGGTSTDVCHYAGAYERVFDTAVAGVHMRVPMLHIHTVAAGGGSILHFTDGKFRVGPDSAGANPGPACYRNGGPLTVTDCNVVLGYIQPAHFPCVFGKNGDLPLDTDVVQQKFIQLADTIYKHIGYRMSVEQIAEGFLRIAVQNMAQAVKKISVQRGYDVTEYVLNCFGGAGGQHACAVADALHMEKIFIHPCAGVLSALGMGLAHIRSVQQRHFASDIYRIQQAKSILDSLEKIVKKDLLNQGVTGENITIIHTAHVKYANAHHALNIAFDTPQNMIADFQQKHKAMYGFIPEYGDIIIEVLSTEAIGTIHTLNHLSPPTSAPSPSWQNPQTVSVYMDTVQQDIPLFHRAHMTAGQTVIGPAILLEPTGTNIITKGWSATVDAFYNLILSRHHPLPKTENISTAADPIMLEVFNNLFMSIAEQMGETLAHTAYSVNIKERLDFSCAIFAPDGALVANAPHVPVHLGSMSDSVKSILNDNKNTLHAGDVFVTNNPFKGGTHLPDITVITPVFDDTKTDIVFIVASRAHHADIGGKTPGSAPPDSTTIYEEGVIIDNFKLIENGKFQDQKIRNIFASGAYPCRNIEQNMADLHAQVAANSTGVIEIQKMIQHFGVSVVHAYMYHMQHTAEQAVGNMIGALQNGKFTYPLDNGAKICVRITVDTSDKTAVIDFTGTSPQQQGNYNAPKSICQAAVLYVLRSLVAKDIPLNDGCMKPITMIIPKGSMIHPDFPSAVIAGNTEVSQNIVDALYGALGCIAASQGTMNNYLYGNDTYQNYETICGGSGAGADFNGTDAVHTHMTNTRMSDPEIIEQNFPVRIETFKIRKNSGGVGKTTGGNGIVRAMRFLESSVVTTLTSHRVVPPFGVNGGGAGKVGQNSVLWADGTRQVLDGNATLTLNKDDIFIIKTPGGGGYGTP